MPTPITPHTLWLDQLVTAASELARDQLPDTGDATAETAAALVVLMDRIATLHPHSEHYDG